MTWPTNPRPAYSLLVLRNQINTRWPARKKDSDGTIGDEAHQSRDSDHNPWVKDGSVGVVTALDITNDPKTGPDAGVLAETLRASHDKRIKYIISRKRIASSYPAHGKRAWEWRPYSGSNPHDKHTHISVHPEKIFYDAAEPWTIEQGG